MDKKATMLWGRYVDSMNQYLSLHEEWKNRLLGLSRLDVTSSGDSVLELHRLNEGVNTAKQQMLGDLEAYQQYVESMNA